MSTEADTLQLIRTKLYRSRITADLVPRPRLLERFEQRVHDPRRRWKLSPMHLQRSRWVDYSKARDAILMHSSSAHALWYIVDANIKRHACLNVISHLLRKIPYEDLTPESLELPPRQEAGDYAHPDFSTSNLNLFRQCIHDVCDTIGLARRVAQMIESTEREQIT